MSASVFGIRHHGPGSARSLLSALTALAPDCLLVEGPPDADGVLNWAMSEDLRPPVAILVYRPDAPRLGAFYPFAEFSPEWQAIRYALGHGVPVRFMDLPQCHQLVEPEEKSEEAANAEEDEPEAPPVDDPLGWLGRAAGYGDGEDWWENMVEQRLDGADLFAAVHDAMAALREEFPKAQGSGEVVREARREAYMRRTIRQAEKEGFERVAVVCGAWHAPALVAPAKVSRDNALLKGLPKAKVAATWVPWTYGRLALSSGYGAGIRSPGWYHHLWSCRSHESEEAGDRSQKATIRWLTRVARLLRAEDLDCSSAHVIEAVRLAESLAALRRRPMPSLDEMNEASLTVMCFGEETPLRWIEEKLTVSERLGRVPDDVPSVPLQQDIEAQQKALRLKPRADEQTVDLDLRKPNGLARSHLLHRLSLLEIPWGELVTVGGKKGTFHEVWTLRWQPEFAVRIIEVSIWGNTVEAAAAAFVGDQGSRAGLPRLAELVDRVLLADLPAALEQLMARLDSEAARAGDVSQLMEALPPLANVMRYGNVRKTDTAQIARVTGGMVARIAIGLPLAAGSLDDDAATHMATLVTRVDSALRLLESAEYLESWQRALSHVVRLPSVNGLLSGRCSRLLLDAGAIDSEEVERQMSLALSAGNETTAAAAWLEGFLAGSGMVLLHDDRLWSVIDEWVSSLAQEAFVHVLPLVRRTFSKFSHPERRQMGVRVKAGRRAAPSRAAAAGEPDLDLERAARVLPIVRRFLGLEDLS